MLEVEHDPEDAAATAPKKKPIENELDMTPMIDVTFLLLIFFMITAAFALQKSLAVPPPDDDEAAASEVVEEVEKDSVTVRIDENNVYWVAVAAEQEQRAVSSQEMRAKVRQAREGTGGVGISKMLVQAHGDAVHEKVVDALDAGSATQMEEIRLMVYEDGDL